MVHKSVVQPGSSPDIDYRALKIKQNGSVLLSLRLKIKHSGILQKLKKTRKDRDSSVYT